MISIADFVKTLDLECLTKTTRTEMNINVTDINRPGMQFCGFYDYFAYERTQVIGKVEMTYLENLEPEARRAMLKKYFSYDLPCVIICRGMAAPPELLEAAGRKRGYLVSGGEVNTERMARVLLEEYRSCKLGRFTLETPEMLEVAHEQ